MEIVLIFLFILIVLFLIIVWHSNISDDSKPKYNPIVVGPDDVDGDTKKICLTFEEREKYNFHWEGSKTETAEYFNSQENLLLFYVGRHTGTDWGYPHHNRALRDWVELAKEYSDENIRIVYGNLRCCASGLKSDNFRVLDIVHYQYGGEIAKYPGDYSKESMEDFILDCISEDHDI